MLIGNTERFAFELHPVEPSWEMRYAPEAAAWAGLSVWVAGKNLCAHVRSGESDVTSAFFVPLGPIADWIVRSYGALVHEERAPAFPTSRALHETIRAWGAAPPPRAVLEDDWLDARERFWARHFLAAGADGAWLPNLSILRSDETAIIAWAPPRILTASLSMLHPTGLAPIPWRDVDATLRELVALVARTFQAKGVAPPYPWVAASEPLDPRDAALSFYCARSAAQIASLLRVPESELASVLGGLAMTTPSTSAICQVFRDLSPSVGADVGAESRSLVERSRHTPVSARELWARARDESLDAARAGESLEEQGQLAAGAVRARLGIDGEPIESPSELASRLGIEVARAEIAAMHERMLVAAQDGGAPVASILDTERTRVRWGCRFEEARAIGHALLDPICDGAMGAASTRWAQDARRRRSGAFAAELLLPATALSTASDGVLDGVHLSGTFETLLHKYGVGARTAAHQLYNHSWLSSRGLRDELIELHAKRD